ncbi:MAG: ribonuclease III [Erysipelotrichaceae bacterium]|nr:ribonuclease III [Erysipelotrichaceae bacterium]
MTIFEWLKEKGINYHQERLYSIAFIHTSYLNEHKKEKNDNERLEFLGDAVLQIWVSERLFQLEPPLHEGKMTTARAQLVCEKSLADYSRQLGLPKFLKLGIGEEKSGGRDRDSILANSFEALLGAVYCDAGMDAVNIILDEVITPIIEHPEYTGVVDYKTQLQEYVQSDSRKNVSYELMHTFGPSNNPKFEVVVKLDDVVLGKGFGKSKKKAEQMAAKDAFDKMVK